MTKQEMIERVAAGLRKIGETPDALLFSFYSTEDDWDKYDIWDEPEILGIPVFHVDYPIYFYFNDSISHPECRFMPIWKSERTANQFLSKQFFEGWEDIKFEEN